MSQLFPLAIYCEDNFCNCCNVRHIICCDMKSGIHFYPCVEWIWCVHGRYLFTLSICETLWVVWCTNTALGRASAGLEHCSGYSPVYSETYAEETSTWLAVNGYSCYWLFSSLGLNSYNMPTLRCWNRSSNFPEFAGRCLDAFASHHSCLSPWPPSAVLSFPTSSPSDDTGPPIPTLQVQRGVTEHSLAWTALPGYPSPRPECNNHRQG